MNVVFLLLGAGMNILPLLRLFLLLLRPLLSETRLALKTLLFRDFFKNYRML